jgi:hypothetical protein
MRTVLLGGVAALALLLSVPASADAAAPPKPGIGSVGVVVPFTPDPSTPGNCLLTYYWTPSSADVASYQYVLTDVAPTGKKTKRLDNAVATTDTQVSVSVPDGGASYIEVQAVSPKGQVSDVISLGNPQYFC